MDEPYFPFFPSDWRGDVALQSCSLTAKGLWIQMLCLLYSGLPRGFLMIGSKNLESDLPHMVGASVEEVEKALAELEKAEVFSRTDEGVIFSRRMVKDQYIKDLRSTTGKKGAEAKRLARDFAASFAQAKVPAKVPANSGYGAGVLLAQGTEPQAAVRPEESNPSSISPPTSTRDSSPPRAKKAKKAASCYPPEWPGHALLALWLAQHPFWREQPPEVQRKATPQLQASLDGLLRIDGHTPAEVEKLLRWVIADQPRDQWQGWAHVMRSPGKLRMLTRDQVSTYWQVISEQMKQRPGGPAAYIDDPNDPAWHTSGFTSYLPGEEEEAPHG